ncbi:MAG: hypothetical protein AAF600_07355, partial [Bacteroidota bacterium]
KGLDLVKYFNDLPNTQILIGQLWGGEVVDDQGFGWWDYYEAEVAAYIAYMRSGAITPVYPESYLIGGAGGIGRSAVRAGFPKQWIRVGSSYSRAGGFKTYGVRWGASGRYVNKIQGKWLQIVPKHKDPFKQLES